MILVLRNKNYILHAQYELINIIRDILTTDPTFGKLRT